MLERSRYLVLLAPFVCVHVYLRICVCITTFSNLSLIGLGLVAVTASAISLPILKACSLVAPFSKTNMLPNTQKHTRLITNSYQTTRTTYYSGKRYALRGFAFGSVLEHIPCGRASLEESVSHICKACCSLKLYASSSIWDSAGQKQSNSLSAKHSGSSSLTDCQKRKLLANWCKCSWEHGPSTLRLTHHHSVVTHNKADGHVHTRVKLWICQ